MVVHRAAIFSRPLPSRLQGCSRAGRGHMEASTAPQGGGILPRRARAVATAVPLSLGHLPWPRARCGLGKPDRAVAVVTGRHDTPRGGCHGTRPLRAGSGPRFRRRRGGCWGRGSMETHELFRRLGAGARFDVRRFGIDARRFGVRAHRGEAGEGSGTGPCAVQAPEPCPFRPRR